MLTDQNEQTQTILPLRVLETNATITWQLSPTITTTTPQKQRDQTATKRHDIRSLLSHISFPNIISSPTPLLPLQCMLRDPASSNEEDIRTRQSHRKHKTHKSSSLQNNTDTENASTAWSTDECIYNITALIANKYNDNKTHIHNNMNNLPLSCSISPVSHTPFPLIHTMTATAMHTKQMFDSDQTCNQTSVKTTGCVQNNFLIEERKLSLPEVF